jgi:hypothetical protein
MVVPLSTLPLKAEKNAGNNEFMEKEEGRQNLS